jgi:hypothetical protein
MAARSGDREYYLVRVADDDVKPLMDEVGDGHTFDSFRLSESVGGFTTISFGLSQGNYVDFPPGPHKRGGHVWVGNPAPWMTGMSVCTAARAMLWFDADRTAPTDYHGWIDYPEGQVCRAHCDMSKKERQQYASDLEATGRFRDVRSHYRVIPGHYRNAYKSLLFTFEIVGDETEAYEAMRRLDEEIGLRKNGPEAMASVRQMQAEFQSESISKELQDTESDGTNGD